MHENKSLRLKMGEYSIENIQKYSLKNYWNNLEEIYSNANAKIWRIKKS